MQYIYMNFIFLSKVLFHGEVMDKDPIIKIKPKNRTSDIGSGNVTCMVIVSSTLTLLHHQPEGM